MYFEDIINVFIISFLKPKDCLGARDCSAQGPGFSVDGPDHMAKVSRVWCDVLYAICLLSKPDVNFNFNASHEFRFEKIMERTTKI